MWSTLEKRRVKRAKLYCSSLSAKVARTQLANWPKAQIECGAMKSVNNSARLMASAVHLLKTVQYHRTKNVDFYKKGFYLFITFPGSKVGFGSKNGVLECFGPSVR